VPFRSGGVDEYLGVDRALALALVLALALSEPVRDSDEVEGTERKSKSNGDLDVLDDVDRVEDEVGADQLRSRRSSIVASYAWWAG
jgi:hypothetical protein